MCVHDCDDDHDGDDDDDDDDEDDDDDDDHDGSHASHKLLIDMHHTIMHEQFVFIIISHHNLFNTKEEKTKNNQRAVQLADLKIKYSCHLQACN